MKSREGRDRRTDVARAADAIQSLIQSLRGSVGGNDRELRISGAQLLILQELAERPAQSVNELASNTHTHQSSVSMVVRRLVDKNLVRRTTFHSDARRVSLSLTAAGKAVVRRAPETSRTRLIAGLESFSRSEIRALADYLETIAKRVAKPPGH
jgi:DNA-binding MarR family transcriptional regulator